MITSVAPLDSVDCAATAIESDLGLAIIGTPDADVLVVGAACQELASRVPLNLLDHLLVALPSLDGALRLVDAPQVDVLTPASDSHVLIILPFNLKTVEILIKCTVIKSSNFFAEIRFAIPNCYDA